VKNLSLSVIPAGDFQILDILLLGHGVLEPKELPSVALPPELSMSHGIVLYGRAPVWLYAYLTHLCHPSPWLAVFDPRQGAIVVEAHRIDAPPVGTILPLELITPYLPKREAATKGFSSKDCPPSCRAVAVIGPPHSGKSVLVYALTKALRAQLGQEGQREVFVLRACPDGEGDWFAEGDPNIVSTLRYKGLWDEDFVAKIVSSIQNLKQNKSLLLVDCGGKIDRYNQTILNVCTHALIVTREDDILEMKRWEGAAQCCDLIALGWVQSAPRQVSRQLSEAPPTFLLGKLERHKEVSEIPAQLLQLLLYM